MPLGGSGGQHILLRIGYPLKGTCQENSFLPNKKNYFSLQVRAHVPNRPSWLLRPFVFSLLMVSGLVRTTHPSGCPIVVGFQKIHLFPASLTGLTGPVVVSHSCFSS